MRYISILLALIFSACSSTGIIRMDGGTYMISKRSAQFGLGPPVGARADIYNEANEFCAKEKKEVETINLDMTDTGIARPGSVSLRFRCK